MKDSGSIDELKAHWKRVANRLHELYENEALTKAGLWHGDPAARASNKLESEALAIIAKWGKIGLTLRESELGELPTHLAKWKADKLPLILFIVEKFDHYDQNQDICNISDRWSRASQLPELDHLFRIKESVLAELERNPNPVDERIRFKFYAEIAENLGLAGIRDAFYMLDFLINYQEEVDSYSSAIFYLRELVNFTFTPQLDYFKKQFSRCFISETPLYWKWHRLDQVLPRITKRISKVKMLPVSDFGQFVVDFQELGACYRTLGLLCEDFPHRAEIYDGISSVTPAPKRSIDLTLVLSGGQDSNYAQQPVAFSIYLRDFGLPYWRKVISRGESLTQKVEISVFTKHGECKRIAAPARLVDFAYAIHLDFIVYFDHAIINERRETNLLGLLQYGDKVVLVKGKAFRWPPLEWLGSLSKEDRDRLMVRLEPLLLEKALRFFAVHYLADDHILPRSKNELLILKQQLDKVWLEHVTATNGKDFADRLGGRAKGNRHIFAELFLRQIVFMHKDELGWPYPNKANVTDKFIRRIAKGLKAATVENGKITAHQPLSENFKLEYYVMVGADRAGLVFDLLQIFYQQRVPILEVTARVSFAGQAFVRITALELPSYKRDPLLPLLKQQMGGGVARWFDETTLPSVEESALPQRMALHNAAYVDLIPTNRPVSEEYLFYGRETEVNKIFTAITRTATPSAATGSLILIKGPLKIGKTSLALNVMNKVKHGYGGKSGKVLPRLIVFVRLGPRATVKIMQQKILREVEFNWQRFAGSCGGRVQKPMPTDMAELIDFLKAVRSKNNAMRPIFLVFVDEIMELFAADNPAAVQNEMEFIEFSNLFETTPGAVLMVAGPQYPLNRCSVRLKNKFDSFDNIILKGLDAKASDALVNREKLHSQGRLPVKITQEICARIFAETGGNPWWLANLTNQLRESGGDLIAQFSDAAWERFVLDFIVQHDLFSDRFLHRSPPDLQIAFAAFKKVISTQIRANVMVVLTPESLLQANSKLGRKEAESLLAAQVDIGGIELSDHGIYHCSAPILEKWLREAVLNGRYGS
jgi:hypothetical protein